METIIFMILIGLAGGISVGLQSPLSSLMSQRIGTLESIFIVHIGGAIAAAGVTIVDDPTNADAFGASPVDGLKKR